MGASLLIFANKTDIVDSMSNEEIRKVSEDPLDAGRWLYRQHCGKRLTRVAAAGAGRDQDA